MTAKEKYNVIINTIENLVQGIEVDGEKEYVGDREINERAFTTVGCDDMDDRSRNILFLFLNNKRVLEYIKESRVVPGYELLLRKGWNKNAISDATRLTLSSSQQEFATKFKKIFNVSPMQAVKNKEKVLVPKIRDWDTISKEGKDMFVCFKEENVVETKFGIEKEKFVLANAAANLQAFYNLNDIESEIAFELSEKEHLDLEETFEYIYNYVWSYLDEESEERDSQIKEDLLQPEVIYMYFKCGMSFNEILLVLRAFAKHKLLRNLEDTDKCYLLGFAAYWRFKRDSSPYILKKNSYSYDKLYQYYFKTESEDAKNDVDAFIRFIKYFQENGLVKAKELSHWDEAEDNGYDEYSYYDWEMFEDDMDKDSELVTWEEYDYEPDFDNPEIVEDLYMENNICEKVNEYRNYYEDEVSKLDFSLEKFEDFCMRLDSEEIENKKEKATRKLIGFRNLTVENIV